MVVADYSRLSPKVFLVMNSGVVEVLKGNFE